MTQFQRLRKLSYTDADCTPVVNHRSLAASFNIYRNCQVALMSFVDDSASVLSTLSLGGLPTPFLVVFWSTLPL